MSTATCSANTTARIVALLMAKLGHADYNPVSDRALGKFFNVSHTQAGKYRRGVAPLPREAAMRALQFARVDDEMARELLAALDYDTLQDDGLKQWFIEHAAGFSMTELQRLRAGIAKSAAGILIGAAAMLAHVDDAAASGKLVVSAHSPAPVEGREYCILC